MARPLYSRNAISGLEVGATEVGGREPSVRPRVRAEQPDGHLESPMPPLSTSNSPSGFYRVQTVCQVGSEMSSLLLFFFLVTSVSGFGFVVFLDN